MTKDQLVQLTKEMRAAQIAYFAAAKDSPEKSKYLSLSRELERRVDRGLDEVLNGNQRRMFDE